MIEFLYRLSPPSVFGLPGDSNLVLPGGEGGVTQIHSDAIDTLSGAVTAYGTFSTYRSPESRVELSFVRDGLTIKFCDNLLTITGDGEPDVLSGRSQIIAEEFSLWLSHHLNNVISPELVHVVDRENRTRIPTARVRRLLGATYYHVPTIMQGVSDFMRVSADGSILAALRHYRMGMFLMGHAYEHMQDFQLHLLQESVLNFHKAVSCILGDPSVDKDYQKRYRGYGISEEFFHDEIEWLRKDIRNDSGIAHYRIDVMSVEELMKICSRAHRIAQTVVEVGKKHSLESTSES